MSHTSEILDGNCKRIMDRFPEGDFKALLGLAKTYGKLAEAFLASREHSRVDTHAVLDDTFGPASDAFENFSHRHTGAVKALAKAAYHVQTRVHEYADECRGTYDKLKPLYDDACILAAWHRVAPNDHDFSLKLIKASQARVSKAIAITDEFIAKAEKLGGTIPEAVDDLDLAEKRARGLAFTGGYGGAHGIHRGTVWTTAAKFLANSQALQGAVTTFANEAEAGAKAIGTDWAGNNFARGYKSAPEKLTTAGKDTVEQLVYIRNALRSMVVRHNRAEDEANHLSEQIKDKIEGVLVPGATPT